MANPILESEKGMRFTRALTRIRTEQEAKEFLSDLMSGPELKNLANRWESVELLYRKESYLDIQKRTGLSSATIAKMSTALKYGTGILNKIVERLG